MLQLSLQQLFGPNAYQDSEKIIIQKSDLTGLTPSVSNSAESLLAAIILQSWKEFEGYFLNEGQKILINGVPILYNFHNNFESLDAFLWRIQIINRSQPYIMHTFVIEEYSPYE